MATEEKVICADCRESKPPDGFYAFRNGRLHYRCKVCHNAKCAAYYKKNKEKVLRICAAWAQKNKDKVNAASRRYRAANKAKRSESTANYRDAHRAELRAKGAEYARANKEKLAAYKVQHRKEKPFLHAAFQKKRETQKIQAMPRWSNEDEIKKIYELAANKTKETGVKYSVDHIVPLQSKLVCGLHVPANLRVIPFTENCSKGNRFWE